jgi:protein-L-isoaspartate(D-aspartate) O-methyltransferase
MIERLREQHIADPRVLAAMAAVPRHIFVEEAVAHLAYDDSPLPLMLGQTISQPFVVARMIELLIVGRELGKTLEIGAGCGYQSAVLAMLSKEVFAVERIAPLLARARDHLRQVGLQRVRLKHADGNLGLPEAAPFDTIIVAAASAHVPQSLRDQLAPGGRLILPLGRAKQVLCLVERSAEGFVEKLYDPVRFVPMLSGVE